MDTYTHIYIPALPASRTTFQSFLERILPNSLPVHAPVYMYVCMYVNIRAFKRVYLCIHIRTNTHIHILHILCNRNEIMFLFKKTQIYRHIHTHTYYLFYAIEIKGHIVSFIFLFQVIKLSLKCVHLRPDRIKPVCMHICMCVCVCGNVCVCVNVRVCECVCV